MSKTFRIRDITAEVGTKETGYLSLQDDDVATVRLLVGIIQGSEGEPVVCITGGMYGSVYPGIEACIRLYNEIDPKKLKGTVITVPVVEMTGFQKCMDISPIDGLNPNGYYWNRQGGLFPGNPEGTISQRIAYVLFNEVIKKSDYHLDLRGGWLTQCNMYLARSCETGEKEFDAKIEALVRILGTEYYKMGPTSKGNLVTEALEAGISSIIFETSPKGWATYDEEDVQVSMRGVYNMLKHLGMIEGKPEIRYKQKKLENKTYYIVAEHGGLLYLNCKTGEIHPKDQKLGEIRNLKGEVLQELIAPTDGLLYEMFPKHIIQPGDLIIGMIKPIQGN